MRAGLEKQSVVGCERCLTYDHTPDLVGPGPYTRSIWSINLDVHVPYCRRYHHALEPCCPDSFAW
jgi:hypothetical protein